MKTAPGGRVQERATATLERVIFLVCADAALTQQFIGELVATGENYQLPLAVSMERARKGFRRVAPSVILLDESAVNADAGESLEAAADVLTEYAPVVVVAAPERQSGLTFLITSGAVDFVARVGSFLPVAVGLLERRVRLTVQTAQSGGHLGLPEEYSSDFGEILRHEVNNPLTGILGNAELLLAESKKKNGDRLSSVAAIQRLQTIADLAVRLRETVRRLSNAWESRHDQVRSA